MACFEAWERQFFYLDTVASDKKALRFKFKKDLKNESNIHIKLNL